MYDNLVEAKRFTDIPKVLIEEFGDPLTPSEHELKPKKKNKVKK